MALPHDPEMGQGDQAAGSHRHQIPTLCLRRACLVPEHQVAVHLPDSPRCWSKPCPVENTVCTKFLPAVLSIDGPIDDKLRTLLRNGVKTGGLAIQDPTLTAASLYSTSVEATDMLTGTLI
ncbi:hypothetical protein ACHAW6_004437 [Cyclotella cf. meneghiniana]